MTTNGQTARTELSGSVGRAGVAGGKTGAQGDPLAQRRLWELAQDASAYLRKHASPVVRVAAALLVAASLAACNASASDTTALTDTQTVAPLAQEVATGLPRGPGSYGIVPGSVFRDQRGVYQIEWLDQGVTSTPGHVAHVSRLRLVRDDTLALEIPAGTGDASGSASSTGQGDDPVLHLPENEDVNLIQEAQVGAAQPGRQYYQPVYGYWNPFLMGMLLGGRPAYYDPPRTIVVEQPAGTSGGSSTIPRVGGGSASETAKPPAQRVTGVQSAVSGRAGGTGTGSAVTNRNLGSGASSAVGSGSTSASSAAKSSGGVSAPRSGGFSSGVGSSGGSSAS